MALKIKSSVRPECFWPPALWTFVAAQWLWLYWFNSTFPVRFDPIGPLRLYDSGSAFWLTSPNGLSMATWWVEINLVVIVLLWLAYRGLRIHTRVFTGCLLAASICLAATSLLVIRSMEARPPLRPAAVLKLEGDAYRCVSEDDRNPLVARLCQGSARPRE